MKCVLVFPYLVLHYSFGRSYPLFSSQLDKFLLTLRCNAQIVSCFFSDLPGLDIIRSVSLGSTPRDLYAGSVLRAYS